eukprot:2494131-Pleurochrysis_carterae.AAC.1
MMIFLAPFDEDEHACHVRRLRMRTYATQPRCRRRQIDTDTRTMTAPSFEQLRSEHESMNVAKIDGLAIGAFAPIHYRSTVSDSWQGCVLMRIELDEFHILSGNGKKKLDSYAHGTDPTSGAALDESIASEWGLTLESPYLLPVAAMTTPKEVVGDILAELVGSACDLAEIKTLAELKSNAGEKSKEDLNGKKVASNAIDPKEGGRYEFKCGKSFYVWVATAEMIGVAFDDLEAPWQGLGVDDFAKECVRDVTGAADWELDVNEAVVLPVHGVVMDKVAAGSKKKVPAATLRGLCQPGESDLSDGEDSGWKIYLHYMPGPSGKNFSTPPPFKDELKFGTHLRCKPPFVSALKSTNAPTKVESDAVLLGFAIGDEWNASRNKAQSRYWVLVDIAGHPCFVPLDRVALLSDTATAASTAYDADNSAEYVTAVLGSATRTVTRQESIAACRKAAASRKASTVHTAFSKALREQTVRFEAAAAAEAAIKKKKEEEGEEGADGGKKPYGLRGQGGKSDGGVTPKPATGSAIKESSSVPRNLAGC